MDEDRAPRGAMKLGGRWRLIRARMEAAGEILARRGSIASRRTAAGTRVFSVRYKEPSDGRQRAIYLGAEGELVRRARALLGGFRDRERMVREVEMSARFATVSLTLLRSLISSRRPAASGGRACP